MNENPINPRIFHARNISWLTIILGLFAVGTFIAISNVGQRYYYATSGGMMEKSGGTTVAVPPMAAGTPARDSSVSNSMVQDGMGSVYYPSPYYNPDVPVTDTREFLKVYYNAYMRSRDVQALTHRVETTVRGYDGRIDQESSSEKYGSVSFAVPQSKYDAFRAELEGLVGRRFITVNVSSQNLLPQKLSIEEQQKQADTQLADYKTTRQKIVTTHAGVVQSIQARIDADEKQLAMLRAQTSTPQIEAQIVSFSNDLLSLKQQLAKESASYTSQLANIDTNIKYAQEWVEKVKTQDKTLLDNVATVTGTVSIQWISLWEIALLYLPGYWIPSIFAALTILSFLWDRRRFKAVVVG
ncbi:MAG: DUF4349 domain-containing protein [Patescibacteria group bacterium]